MGTYRQPRRFNWVSLPIYAAIAAALYSIVQFGPPVYRNMKVDEVIREAVNSYYAATRGAASGDAPDELRHQVEQRIRNLGIDDPQLALFFDKDAEKLTVTARYTVVVQHPFVKRTTMLEFAPSAKTPLVDPSR
jgi:hypothetical protein